jgi:hypothetical protein
MSVEAEVIAWLEREQHNIEDLLISLLEADLIGALNWPPYERAKAFEQTLNLGSSLDCNYDRPTVGVAYATWYMPRRIQDATRALIPILCNTEKTEISVVDLGCGTGATWWAIHFILQAMTENGRQPPKVEVIGCDISVPMLNVAKSLWSRLTQKQESLVHVTSELTSWTALRNLPHGSVIFASYLLDQSDKYRIVEVGRTLCRLAEAAQASDVIIIGASNKKTLTSLGIQEFTRDQLPWQKIDTTFAPQIWNGAIPGLSSLRKRLTSDCGGISEDYGSRKIPNWTPDGADFVHLINPIGFETLFGDNGPFQNFALDEAQEIAAIPDDRMTAILGAAGSGKSRVLVERLTRTIQRDLGRNTDEQLRYLVTTFNHSVRQQLRRWLIERMENDPRLTGRVVARGEEIVVVDQRITVRFLTWDTVVKRSFGIATNQPSADSEEVMERIIGLWAGNDAARIKWLEDNDWVTPKFVLQEIKRVVYGQQATTLERYLATIRRGRPGPRMTEQRRRAIWSLLDRNNRFQLWIDRRSDALDRLENGFRPIAYNYIFLDECQDFVEADFRIIEALIVDTHQLTVCGDGAQALHTGPGYSRPRRIGNANWSEHVLEGSYRLPIRVCEAIAPIAMAIQKLRETQGGAQDDEEFVDPDQPDITLPRSVKNAEIGTRPIILAPGTLAELREQIIQVSNFYAPLIQADGEHPTITNADNTNKECSRILREAATAGTVQYLVEDSTMLWIKGLERKFIFWSTFFHVANPGSSTYEWVYTILTRTTRLLVVMLSKDTSDDIKSLVGRMNKDCLLFWNEDAERQFDEFSLHVNSESDPFSRIR